MEPIPERVSETTDPASEASSVPQMVVWGTNVVVNHCKNKFKQFLLRYIDPTAEQDEISENIDVNQPLYLQKLEEIHTLEEPYLNLNCSHLKTFDEALYRQLICYPQEVIPSFDMAINEMFFERYPAAVLEHQIQVRPFNADKTRNMRSLNPEDMDQLISISGMVIRTSNVIPEMREAFFKCIICDFVTTVEVDRGRIAQPTLCTNCNTNHCFRLVHNRSEFTDKQLIKLQESPDDMAAGQTPHNVLLYAHNDLVDKVQPGDRVTVTGIYRATPMKNSHTSSSVKSVYKTHVDVVHFRKVDNKRLYEEEEGYVKMIHLHLYAYKIFYILILAKITFSLRSVWNCYMHCHKNQTYTIDWLVLLHPPYMKTRILKRAFFYNYLVVRKRNILRWEDRTFVRKFIFCFVEILVLRSPKCCNMYLI